MGKPSVAISKSGKDCLRIIPLEETKTKVELKFALLNNPYLIRDFRRIEGNFHLLYAPFTHNISPSEITYHNPKCDFPEPTVLPKYKEERARKPITQEIVELNLNNLILPLPVCRITINQDPESSYRHKSYHSNINLSTKYNTTEIFISSEEYDFETMAKKFPLIVNTLFPLSTLDSMIYGAGIGSEPIFNKMIEENAPISALATLTVGKYRIYYRTYQLLVKDNFLLYSNEIYRNKNIIEFFNNVDFLDLLATTRVGFDIPGKKKVQTKLAYKYDIEYLEKSDCKKKYVRSLEKRFRRKEAELKSLNKFRTGILFKR